jgi:outer membrane protein assembly factor BamB
MTAQTPPTSTPQAMPENGSLPPVPMARADPGNTNNHPGPPPSGVPEIRGVALRGERVDVQPLIADDTVFVVTNLTHRLVAIDAASGEERWSVDGAAETEPVIVDDTVIYETANPVDRSTEPGPAALTALDRETGRQVHWSTPLSAYATGRLVLAGDLVLVPTEKNVFALDARTGRERWTYSGLAVSDIAAEGETVVLNSTTDGELVALDLSTGGMRWSIEPKSLLVRMLIVDGMIYATSEPDLVALDLASGNEAWRMTLPAPTDELHMLAASGTTLLAADSEGLLFAVDATSREIIWTYERRNGFEYSDRAPVVAGELVFIQGEDGTYEAIDLGTGKPQYELPLPQIVEEDVRLRSLTVSGGWAFLSTTEGVVFYEGSQTEPSGIEDPFGDSTFTSAFFGYSLSWDERWRAGAGGSEEGGDLVSLATTPSAPVPASALIYTTEPGSLQDNTCAEQISEFPLALWLAEAGTDGIDPALDKVPATGLPPGADATAIHVSSHAKSDVAPYTGLIVCVPVEASDRWIVFELYADDPYYEEAIPMFLDLLAGFDPDGGTATPPSTTRPRATRYR